MICLRLTDSPNDRPRSSIPNETSQRQDMKGRSCQKHDEVIR